MNAPDDLMSFLTSASRHVTVNQERLAESAREEVRQEVEEQQAEAAAAEGARVANEELIRYAMQNLGLTANQSPSTEPTNSTASATENIETISPDPYCQEIPQEQEPEPEPEPDIPENEKAIVIPTYSSIREELVRFSDAEWFNKGKRR